MTDDRIKRVCEAAEGPTILDLGAVQHDLAKTNDDAWLHEHLVERFDRVIGVDILAHEVHALNQQGYEMMQADVTSMNLDVTADTVVAGELIEHVANPGLMLERASAHLKDGGKVVLTTPNPWAFVHLRRLLTRTHSINDEHVGWYGPVVLRQLLNRYGFAIETMQTTRRGHGGITGIAQRLNSDVFGGTTWVCVATKEAANGP